MNVISKIIQSNWETVFKKITEDKYLGKYITRRVAKVVRVGIRESYRSSGDEMAISLHTKDGDYSDIQEPENVVRVTPIDK